ncbi:hypothetical protein LTR17_012244 [Elasticomyces elasticus]|nr:hypothetical protein LTR17_012244 [Elasticomyces elasticus]
MALRRALPEEWVPSPTTKIHTRPAWQPRDECARLPKSVLNRGRPAPSRLLTPPEALSVASPPLPFKDVYSARYGTPQDPEIVDLAVPSTWPRRGAPLGPPPKQAPPSIRIASPSLHSRCSTSRRSEVSFGILDYYTREPSPLPSPDFPPPPPPKVDPAMEKFDFQLVTSTPKVPASTRPRGQSETQAGAQEPAPLVDVSLASQPAHSAPHKRAYSLFPVVKDTPNMAVKITALPSSPATASPTAPSITHQPPDPSYRPRKVSLSGSVRSRKDSFTSFRSNRRIPLRILSSNSSTPSAPGRLDSRTTSTSTTSPPIERLKGHNSRWSDESTIMSPTAAITPNGPRTSFGSLLLNDIPGRRSSSGQYPACFFEDDEDESAPLRKKFGWSRRSTSLTVKEIPQTKHKHGSGRFDDRPSFGHCLKRIVLCSGCTGSKRRSAQSRRGTL